MEKVSSRQILFFILLMALPTFFASVIPQVQAQDAAGESLSGDLLKDTKTDLFIIGGITLSGAFLGLSTLSFKEDPKDHFKNISIGAALGIIVAVGVVAWRQANKSKTLYNRSISDATGSDPTGSDAAGIGLDTAERLKWHQRQHASLHSKVKSKFPVLSYSFSF